MQLHDMCNVKGGVKMDARKIGKRLKDLRGKKSQAEVANEVKITVSALSMYESGSRIPRDEVKERFASYYNLPVQTIFYD